MELVWVILVLVIMVIWLAELLVTPFCNDMISFSFIFSIFIVTAPIVLSIAAKLSPLFTIVSVFAITFAIIMLGQFCVILLTS
ncbi:MAG: hypothetical protein ACFFBS_07285 [Promethearchaeota archaeon]